MTARRMGRHSGRAASVAGTIGALALLAGCATEDGGIDYARACATLERDPIVVEDARCESTNVRAADEYGWYYVQVPATRYEHDEDGYSYPIGNDTDVIFVAVGQPLSGSTAGGQRATTTRVLPQGINPSRVASAGNTRSSTGTAGKTSTGATISRGGLGISSKAGSGGSGASSGSKGGSAGS